MALAAYKRNIAKAVSGNLQLFVATAATASGSGASVTLTSGEISAFTPGTGLKFLEIQGDIDSVQFTSDGKHMVSGSIYENKMIVKMTVGKTDLKTLVDELAANIGAGLIFIRTDGNKKAFLSGYGTDLADTDRSYRSFEYKYDSGVSPTEDGKQMVELTFSSKMVGAELPFNATLSGTISAKTNTTLITYAS